MSLINFPGLVDTFPTINAAGGDNLNTAGKEHDVQHNKITQAVVALERVVGGPTQYNVAGYPQTTFDGRFAAALADAHSGGGVVVVTPGAYTSAGLGSVTLPTVSIWGPAGATATQITRTGGTALLNYFPSPLTVAQMGVLRGIKLIGDSTANIKGILCTDTGTLPGMEDVVISGFTGSGAVGLDILNSTLWNERGFGYRVHLDNNTIGMRHSASGSANSFFYHRWPDLRFNVNAGQVGFQMKGTALLQGGNWNVICNIGGTGGILFDLQDTSSISGWVFASGEQTAGTGGITRKLAAGATWAANGMCLLNGCSDSDPSGRILSPFEVSPFGQILSRFPATPTVAIGAAAGTSPPPPTIQGNDIRGLIGGGTGTSTAAGNYVTVTFNQPYPTTPYVTINPFGNIAASYRPFIAAMSATSFTIGFVDPPAASQAAGTVAFTYHVSG